MIIASRNPGKVREIKAICYDWPVEWVTDEEVSWPDVEETGSSYLENALLKARTVVEATGEAALADDSGIEVDALGGGPGPRSARYAGEGASDEENLRALLRALAGVPGPGRTARYRAVAA
ncbi:MAG: non-canonical purine NTP pyrophosphatase, partial [Actinomycetota bacterium]